ncbi:hypothetical protein ACOSQ3_018793 [Xanthoceras sorbifolium]
MRPHYLCSRLVYCPWVAMIHLPPRVLVSVAQMHHVASGGKRSGVATLCHEWMSLEEAVFDGLLSFAFSNNGSGLSSMQKKP